MTVEHLLKTMSARELMEWRAFIEVERGSMRRTAVEVPDARTVDDQITAVFGPLTTDPGGSRWQSSP